MPVHPCVAECAWNVGYMPLGGISFFEAVPLMGFMYLVFTREPSKSYSRQLRFLLYLCYVFRALINSFGCWLETSLVWDFLRQDYHRQTDSRDAWRETTLVWDFSRQDYHRQTDSRDAWRETIVWDFTSLRLLTSGLSQADSRDQWRETTLVWDFTSLRLLTSGLSQADSQSRCMERDYFSLRLH